MRVLSDLKPDLKPFGAGFLLMFASGYGQTFYVALFAGAFRSAFDLTNGEFGGIYTLATLASALVLTAAGHLADTIALRRLGAGVLLGLAAASAITALAWHPLLLGLGLFSLRFFGQGMCTHTAMTAMGRWFDRRRGRAVAIASLGLPGAEALLPLLAVSGMAVVGWRATWAASAVVLACLGVPLYLALLRQERRLPHRGPGTTSHAAPGSRRHWTRGEVLANPMFYGLLVVMLAPPFIVTWVFFNQVALVELRGWTLTWFAAWYPLAAITHVIASLLTGALIDRFSARAMPVLFLLPLALGTWLLATFAQPLVVPLAIALLGFAIGCAGATQGALWAEVYGTAHLGAVRSLAAAGAVFSTAIAPALAGALLDNGVQLDVQFGALAAYAFFACGWMLLLRPRLETLLQAGRQPGPG